jgi:hypothetical protein
LPRAKALGYKRSSIWRAPFSFPPEKVSRGKFIALAVAVRVDRRFAFGLQRLRSVDKPIWLVAFFFAPVAKWIFFALKP